MGGIPKNRAGTERVRPWGVKTAYRKATADREGWEVFLPLTGGGHEGIGSHRRPNVNKQKAEHGRAVYFCATASGPLRGGEAERGGAGNNEVVVPDGYRLGEGESEGSGNGIRVRFGDRHGGGGDAGHRKQDKRIKWGVMERSECGRMGSTEY